MDRGFAEPTHWFRQVSAAKSKGPAVAGQALDLVGGAKGDRTPDLYNAIVALSQLSYGPEVLGKRARGISPGLPAGNRR